MIKYFLKISLLTLAVALSGCAGYANRQITKITVPQQAPQVREMVEELRRSDPVPRDDLSSNLLVPSEGMRINDIFNVAGFEDPTKFNHKNWSKAKISTNLVNVKIIDFFSLLDQIVDVNFIVGDDVAGDLTFNIKDMLWTDAVETVLSAKQLFPFISADGKHVRIHTVDFASKRSETVKKILDLNNAEASARRAGNQKSTSIIRIFYSTADQIVKTLSEMINGPAGNVDAKSGVGSAPTGATFTVEPRTNSVIIQATTLDLDWIKKTISAIDKPSKQILVEAFIVEGRDNFTQELGTRLGVVGRNGSISGLGAPMTTSVNAMGETLSTIGSVSSPSLTNTAIGGLGVFARGGLSNLKIELFGMERDGLTKILSNPRLFIMDNEQAQITDGVQIPYPVSGADGVTYEFKDAALKLEVKPSIVGDGNIYIEVAVNKDSPNYTTNPPAIDKREVKTKLLIKDGGVAMLGGINSSTINSTDNAIPVLGKIPGIGNLFKGTEQSNDRRQLYIFLSPSTI
jgi:type IV pilus assembly protein PilQ